MVAGEAPVRRPPGPPSVLFGLRPVHARMLRLRRPRLLASLSLYTRRGPMGTSVGSASRFGSLVPRAVQPQAAAIWSPDAAVEGGRAGPSQGRTPGASAVLSERPGRPRRPSSDETVSARGRLQVVGAEDPVQLVHRTFAGARAESQLLGALDEARQVIRASEVALRRALRKSKRGSDVATRIIAANPAEFRRMVNDALTAVEQCRHDMRRTVIAVALKRGTSITDLGNAWGFCRPTGCAVHQGGTGRALNGLRLKLTHCPAG